MIGPCQRHEHDDAGRRMDAAQRILTAARAELEELLALSGEPENLEHLLYMVVVTMVDEQIDAGTYPEVAITPALARVEHGLIEMFARRMAGGPP